LKLTILKYSISKKDFFTMAVGRFIVKQEQIMQLIFLRINLQELLRYQDPN
jgi:hypothetical protein